MGDFPIKVRMSRKLIWAALLTFILCLFGRNDDRALAQPCQWNYSMQPGSTTAPGGPGTATATYCGNVVVNGSIIGGGMGITKNYTTLRNVVALANAAVYVMDTTRYGEFNFRTGDQSANIAADAQGCIWVAPNSDATGASGAWQRALPGGLLTPQNCGAIGDNSTNNAVALTAWLTHSSDSGVTGGFCPAGNYRFGTALTIPDGTYITADTSCVLKPTNTIVSGGSIFYGNAVLLQNFHVDGALVGAGVVGLSPVITNHGGEFANFGTIIQNLTVTNFSGVGSVGLDISGTVHMSVYSTLLDTNWFNIYGTDIPIGYVGTTPVRTNTFSCFKCWTKSAGGDNIRILKAQELYFYDLENVNAANAGLNLAAAVDGDIFNATFIGPHFETNQLSGGASQYQVTITNSTGVTFRDGYFPPQLAAQCTTNPHAISTAGTTRNLVIDNVEVCNGSLGTKSIILGGNTSAQFPNWPYQVSGQPSQAIDNSTNTVGAVVFYNEVGTWSPSLGGSATYNAGNAGKYSRINNTVCITGRLDVNAIGTGSTGTISGLPFPTSVTTGDTSLVIGGFGSLSTSVVSIYARIPASGQTITILGLTAAAASVSALTPFQNGSAVNLGGCYPVN